jgi:hypothetical protein
MGSSHPRACHSIRTSVHSERYERSYVQNASGWLASLRRCRTGKRHFERYTPIGRRPRCLSRHGHARVRRTGAVDSGRHHRDRFPRLQPARRQPLPVLRCLPKQCPVTAEDHACSPHTAPGYPPALPRERRTYRGAQIIEHRDDSAAGGASHPDPRRRTVVARLGSPYVQESAAPT